MEQIPC